MHSKYINVSITWFILCCSDSSEAHILLCYHINNHVIFSKNIFFKLTVNIMQCVLGRKERERERLKCLGGKRDYEEKDSLGEEER